MKTPILLVTELFPPAIGGSAVLLANVYGRLSDIPVTVLSNPTSIGDVSSGTLPVVPVSLNGSYRGLRPSAALSQHFRVGAAIRAQTRHRPTIVHCARPLPEGLAALVSRGMRSRAPYVTWAHGEELTAAMTSREHTWLARQVCLRASAIIASTKFTATVAKDLGVPSDRIRVIHPGVDAGRFTPEVVPSPWPRLTNSGEGPYLLSVGRLQRRKGHDTAIQAVSLLRGEFPQLRYFIVGDGFERGRLEQLARDCSVSEHVVFVGEVDEADLPGWYTACDIFLLPNRTDHHDVEGFGIVFLEAAASARPSIGGRSGGVPEAIVDGQTGLLVSGTDHIELAEAIRTLARSRSLREAMGEAGRSRVLSGFTWDRAAAQLRSLHEDLARLIQ